jgi:hypothetical protein
LAPACIACASHPGASADAARLQEAASLVTIVSSAGRGSLASFGARSYNGSTRICGTHGNSFVAAVETGYSVRARAITPAARAAMRHPGTSMTRPTGTAEAISATSTFVVPGSPDVPGGGTTRRVTGDR